MPRLAEARRSEIVSDEIQSALQNMFGDRDPEVEPGANNGTPGNWWTVFATEPGIFHLTELRHQWQYSPERSVDPVHREIAIARTGWARGSQFVFSQHSKIMRRQGIPEEKIQAIPHWATSSAFTEDELLVLGYTDDLVLNSGRVSDQRFAELRKHLSDVAILELTFMVCTYEMSAKMCLALKLEFDDRPDPVVEFEPPERN
jgi:alkylhydroperoxidase family enzyme